MVIYSKRHDLDLYLHDKIVIAPRLFVIDDYMYFVHIVDAYCLRVLLYSLFLPFALCSDKYNVFMYGSFKLYFNTKGLYFNFRKNRIYICG